jgi:hypothetical protein
VVSAADSEGRLKTQVASVSGITGARQKGVKTTILLLAPLMFMLGASIAPQDSSTPVGPAKLEPMRSFAFDASTSGRPVELPRSWGRVVGIQKMDAGGYSLFLENENGEIYVVRLVERNQVLYLDNYNQSGTALVIRRNP